ncbi:hypothetical protein EYC84_010754 [Monilinia fructicola]|uniref:Uncharacterized protein n=1 Tax=Monilinia fructicola TaxID=38448 RepID=A0A5M9JCM6_MONFR|nr:hypothetical protein EYC84_010754 [Monilinia fructicola]
MGVLQVDITVTVLDARHAGARPPPAPHVRAVDLVSVPRGHRARVALPHRLPPHITPAPATRTPFLAPTTGTIFHITTPAGPPTPQPPTYQTHTLPLDHLPTFIPTLLFILKLCPIDAILHPALVERLGILGLQAQLKGLEMMTTTAADEGEGEGEGEGAPEEKAKEETEEAGTEEEEEEQVTCQSWIRSTLHVLDEEGYISFPETIGPKIVVDNVEAEAVAGAMWNKMRGTVGWERSAWIGE